MMMAAASLLRFAPALLGLAVGVGSVVTLFSNPPRAAPLQLQNVAETLLSWRSKPEKKEPKKKSAEESKPEKNSAPLVTATLQIIIREAREQMGVDCIKYYNFAVTGQSGVGKSSFVNAVLGLEGNNACPVGEVETTQEIRSYSCKKLPYLKLWDIPGAGTRNHPASTYFEDKKLYVFDTILILSSDRFLEVDFEILRSAHKFKTPCVFVRTKCDTSVENRAKRDKVNALEASRRFRAEVSSSFHVGLANAGLIVSSSSDMAPQLYFISNKFLSPENEDAYSIYDKKTKTLDCSLSCMDEHILITFLLDVAKRRA